MNMRASGLSRDIHKPVSHRQAAYTPGMCSGFETYYLAPIGIDPAQGRQPELSAPRLAADGRVVMTWRLADMGGVSPINAFTSALPKTCHVT